VKGRAIRKDTIWQRRIYRRRKKASWETTKQQRKNILGQRKWLTEGLDKIRRELPSKRGPKVNHNRKWGWR